MAYIIDGKVDLHKTHVSTVGYNLCDPDAVEAKNFDVNCSLVCYLGEAFVSGQLVFNLYREDCNGSLIGTRLFTPNMFMISVGCPTDYDEDSPRNNTWVGSITTETAQGHDYGWGPNFGYRIKMDATVVAISPSVISVTISTSRLMPDLTWFGCNSISLTLKSVGVSTSESLYKYYESELAATSFDLENCGGEVKYVKASLNLEKYVFGCSETYESYGQKCNLSTNRGGFLRQYSCLVCLIKPKDGLSFSPKVVQLGVNPFECENSNDCRCLHWDGYRLNPQSPRHDMDESMVTAGCPNETPSSNPQKIQFGGVNEYRVLLKTIKDGAICVAARYLDGPWVVGVLTILKYTNPFIMQADFSGLLSGNPVFQFYGMEFPTSVIEDCQVNPVPEVVQSVGFEENLKDPLIEYHKKEDLEEDAKVAKALDMVRKIHKIKQKPCINLGMALEKVASCGCGGSVLHECKKHGTCRQSGNDEKVQLCWKCSDYSGE